MGHGPARELSTGDDALVDLDPESAARLEEALAKLDRVDPKFKAARDEERFAQNTKMWHRTCSELDGNLRKIAKVLFASHQLNLDIGSDGGGVKARPWLEDLGKVFDRLYFKLEGANVVATSGERVVATVPVRDLNYGFVEHAVVEWVVGVAATKR